MHRKSIEDKARIYIEKVMLEEKIHKHLIEIKDYDEDLYKHSINVAFIVTQIAYIEKYDAQKKYDLTVASLLHDLGKVKIPKEILNKEDTLTQAEFAQIKKHVTYGADILEEEGFNKRITTYVLMHHENISNTGYLKLNIKLRSGSKLISTVDKYDALTSDRCYSKAITKEQALVCLQNEQNVEDKYIRLLNKCEAM